MKRNKVTITILYTEIEKCTLLALVIGKVLNIAAVVSRLNRGIV